MRQWLLEPVFMCGKHIGAEHLETHMFLSAMREGRSLQGFYDHGLFFGPKFLKERHDLLAFELDGHQTPLEFDSEEFPDYPDVRITEEAREESNRTLLTRCQSWREKGSSRPSHCNDWSIK